MMKNMRYRRLLTNAWLLLCVVALASCTKDVFDRELDGQEQEENASKMTAYMTLTLRALGGNGSGGSDFHEDKKHHHVGEWKGDDRIDDFTLYFISDKENKVEKIEGKVSEPGQGKWEWDEQTLTLTLNPWRTTPGPKTVYAFFNIVPKLKNALDAKLDNKEEFLKEINKPYDSKGEGVQYGSVSDNSSSMVYPVSPEIARRIIQHGNESPDWEEHEWDRIMMSGKGSVDVRDGVSEETVKANKTNTAYVDMRRVVARAIVTVPEGLFNKTGGSTSPIVPKAIRWQVFQFENSFYPIPNGDNVLTTKSPNYDYKPQAKFLWEDPDKATMYYTPATAGITPKWNDVLRIPDGESFYGTDKFADRLKKAPWIMNDTWQFINETTHTYGVDGEWQNSGYRKGNTAMFVFNVYVDPLSEDLNWHPDAKAMQYPKYLDTYFSIRLGDAKEEAIRIYYNPKDGTYDLRYDRAYRHANGGKPFYTNLPDTEEKRKEVLVAFLEGNNFFKPESVKKSIANQNKYITKDNAKYPDKDPLPLIPDDVVAGIPADTKAFVDKYYNDLLPLFRKVEDEPGYDQYHRKATNTRPEEFINKEDVLKWEGAFDIPYSRYTLNKRTKQVEKEDKTISLIKSYRDLFPYFEQYYDKWLEENNSKIDHTQKDNLICYCINIYEWGAQRKSPKWGMSCFYYAWVNPNTNNNKTWYSGPVLRNNIYNIHINSFTKMGMSGNPFIKYDPSKPLTMYNLPPDPDEKMDIATEYLPIEDPFMAAEVAPASWGVHSYTFDF